MVRDTLCGQLCLGPVSGACVWGLYLGPVFPWGWSTRLAACVACSQLPARATFVPVPGSSFGSRFEAVNRVRYSPPFLVSRGPVTTAFGVSIICHWLRKLRSPNLAACRSLPSFFPQTCAGQARGRAVSVSLGVFQAMRCDSMHAPQIHPNRSIQTPQQHRNAGMLDARIPAIWASG